MFEYRFDENDERQRYRKQILLWFFKIKLNVIDLCLINVVNDLYDRILKINKENENCDAYREILKTKKSIHDDINFTDCEIKNEVLFKNDNLWIFNQMNFLLNVIRDAHDQFFSEYSKMNHIEKFIKRYIRNCHNCRRIKFSHDECNNLLKFLFIFKQRWVDIAMNFVINFSNSKNNNVICIIIDCLVKKRHYAFCTSVTMRFQSKFAFAFFLIMCFEFHELFSSIVSNGENQFVNTIWNKVCKNLSIKCKLFTAFHFQTNDQTKWINQNIETRLRHYVNYIQDDWIKWINILKLANNNV